MIKILFFAALKEQLGCNDITLPLDDEASVEQIISLLIQQHPHWEKSFKHTVLCAVNQEMVNKEHIVKSDDEVAFFPPVTGG